jgi:hypothetical protein
MSFLIFWQDLERQNILNLYESALKYRISKNRSFTRRECVLRSGAHTDSKRPTK